MMMRPLGSVALLLCLISTKVTVTEALSVQRPGRSLFLSNSYNNQYHDRTKAVLQRLKKIAINKQEEDLPVPPSKQIGYGEASRKYRRTIYTHNDWERHRRQDRFIHNLSTAMASGIYKNIRKYVVTVTGLATAILVWNKWMATYLLAPKAVRILQLPMAPFSLAMPSLGLLLVFRTNTAYARWDEARKNWGLNINHTRDLCRQVTAMYDAAMREAMATNGSSRNAAEPSSTAQHAGYPWSAARRQADLQAVALGAWAYARAMKRHLSPEADEGKFRTEVRAKLPAAQATALIAATHRPNRALQDLSATIEALPLHFMRKDKLHASLTRFEDNLGSSERLLSSPVPLFYTRHTTRFLAVWQLLLPFALYQAFGGHMATLPATAILSTCLFGIDELSTQLEEPFTILPMQSFCNKIWDGCMEIVNFAPISSWQQEQDEQRRRATHMTTSLSRSAPSTSTASDNDANRRGGESSSGYDYYHQHHQQHVNGSGLNGSGGTP